MTDTMNKCRTCASREPELPGAFCEMWRSKPITRCLQHTIRKVVRVPRATIPPLLARTCLSCGSKEAADGSIPCGH